MCVVLALSLLFNLLFITPRLFASIFWNFTPVPFTNPHNTTCKKKKTLHRFGHVCCHGFVANRFSNNISLCGYCFSVAASLFVSVLIALKCDNRRMERKNKTISRKTTHRTANMLHMHGEKLFRVILKWISCLKWKWVTITSIISHTATHFPFLNSTSANRRRKMSALRVSVVCTASILVYTIKHIIISHISDLRCCLCEGGWVVLLETSDKNSIGSVFFFSFSLSLDCLWIVGPATFRM